jgi:2-polyprenyl-3-methyl-5-hydroxy-6-metoxy-1,4-benzoquinol methylase
MQTERLLLGTHGSFNLWNDPKRLAFVLARYKFSANLACRHRTVLELGCSEGIGATFLAEWSSHYTGVDMDAEAVAAAKRNWRNDKLNFIEEDFLGKTYGTFDTIVSLDVVEHIEPEREFLFFETILKNLGTDGIGIVGTPNITSVPYASPASQLGHVNMFSAERLKTTMEQYFHNVFVFGLNDEMVHTGFASMTHYLMCVGCYRK